MSRPLLKFVNRTSPVLVFQTWVMRKGETVWEGRDGRMTEGGRERERENETK